MAGNLRAQGSDAQSQRLTLTESEPTQFVQPAELPAASRAPHGSAGRLPCKRLKVEPYAYLHDVLRRLPSHPNKDIWLLTPRGWQETFAPKAPTPSPSG